LKKNLISARALKAQGLRWTLGKSVLKMFSGLLVVLKAIRHNNLYYLKGSAVTENLATSKYLECDFYQVMTNDARTCWFGFFASFGEVRIIRRYVDLHFEI